jgi:anti-sigma regulatory factor (Ser/Thr protein kinase)
VADTGGKGLRGAALQRHEDSFAYHLARNSWGLELVRDARFDLGGGPESPARARQSIIVGFSELLDPAVAQSTVLLVSELVTNAVIHGHANGQHHVIMHVALATERLRVEVCDSGPGFDPIDLPKRSRKMGGKGLVLLDALASRWGVSSDDGTCIWFEIDQ